MRNSFLTRATRQAGMLLMLSLMIAVSCDNVIDDPFVKDQQEMSLPEIARMMAELPLGEEQLREVHGAVVSSSEHGYDEEYTMRDIFLSPGAGVGASEEETRAGGGFDQPLRSLIESWLGERLRSRAGDSGIDTRSSSGGSDGIWGISTKASATVEDYITALTESDAQIYWPYSASWDGETMPVITYDPLTDTDTNVGYVLTESGLLEEVVVSEEMASERPVWVINRNDDSAYESLEMLRRRDPSWGQGGSIVVRSGSYQAAISSRPSIQSQHAPSGEPSLAPSCAFPSGLSSNSTLGPSGTQSSPSTIGEYSSIESAISASTPCPSSDGTSAATSSSGEFAPATSHPSFCAPSSGGTSAALSSSGELAPATSYPSFCAPSSGGTSAATSSSGELAQATSHPSFCAPSSGGTSAALSSSGELAPATSHPAICAPSSGGTSAATSSSGELAQATSHPAICAPSSGGTSAALSSSGEGDSMTTSPSGIGPGRVAESGSDSGEVKTLILKDFTMKRNYDSWFAGASEFFVKCGAVEDFKATTESELLLYSPNITDFMIVVRRDQVGQKLPFNAVLVSDWTDQLENFAFMITEDDGGTRTTWKTNAEVKVKSKTYGINLEIPYNTRDDIVWRGKLSSRYFTKNADVQGHFGDVSLTFSFE